MSGLAKLAGIWCADAEFLRWLEGLAGQPFTQADAVEFVHLAAGVASRKDLDSAGAAADRFNEKVRKPFMAWRRRRT